MRRRWRDGVSGEVPIVRGTLEDTTCVYQLGSTNMSEKLGTDNEKLDTHLVVGVKLRPRRQCARVLRENLLRGCGSVDNDHWDVAELDLIDRAVRAGPGSVALCGTMADVPDVADHGKSTLR